MLQGQGTQPVTLPPRVRRRPLRLNNSNPPVSVWDVGRKLWVTRKLCGNTAFPLFFQQRAGLRRGHPLCQPGRTAGTVTAFLKNGSCKLTCFTLRHSPAHNLRLNEVYCKTRH